MELWIQGTLFPTNVDSKGRARRSVSSRRAASRRLPVGWTPVTRDPAVAASSAESSRLAGDVRSGLARSLDRLSPELRHAIRAAVSRAGAPVAA